MIVRSALLVTAVVALTASPRAAAADPKIDALEHALPAGWSLIATDSELVLRHDHAVYLASSGSSTAAVAASLPGAAPPSATAARDDGPLVTLELRYHLEPKWTPTQLARAKLTNGKLNAQLGMTRARLHIDDIATFHGIPRPATADERSRVTAYARAQAAMIAKHVAIPTCTLGAFSVFDGPQTYAELSRPLDPPSANAEGYAVVELVKQHCTK